MLFRLFQLLVEATVNRNCIQSTCILNVNYIGMYIGYKTNLSTKIENAAALFRVRISR